MIIWLIIPVTAFLVGSIPFGLLIGRVFYKTDIRATGSGNIGAMNALRSLGKKGAVAVLLLDALKGFVPVYVCAHWIDTEVAVVVAVGAILGHCFSPWLGWKGGKGVATSFGAIFGLSWVAGLIAVGGWVVGAAATQYSSVGSILGSLTVPFALWFLTGSVTEACYGAFAAVLILFTHRENLGRLRSGTENRIRLSRQP